MSQFFKERRGFLYHPADGAVVCKRKDEEKLLYCLNCIRRSYWLNTIIKWGIRVSTKCTKNSLSVCQARDEKGLRACLSFLLVKDPKKMMVQLKSVQRSALNEIVEIDHQLICMIETGYIQILLFMEHFIKIGRGGTLSDSIRKRNLQIFDHTMDLEIWLSHDFLADNTRASVGDLDKYLIKKSHLVEAHSMVSHPQINGLVEMEPHACEHVFYYTFQHI